VARRKLDLLRDRDWHAELERLEQKLQRIKRLLSGRVRLKRHWRKPHDVPGHHVKGHWVYHIQEKDGE